MGLPEINIAFTGKAVSAVKRSSMGIVALILNDDTPTFSSKEFKSIEDINVEDFTATNLDYLYKTFDGTPSKVLVEIMDTEEDDYTLALKNLGSKKWNYLAIPGIKQESTTAVVSWIKSKRENDKKTFKAILPHADAADHEGIINFTTENITVGLKTYSASEYTCRIAGILAGLPFTRSATFYELGEVDSILESSTPDEDIDEGKLILINDGEKIKIGRGVNSLTTTTLTKTDDFKKIKVLEVMDMITDDIRTTFNDEYVGKVPNIYDNQVLFFTSINSYLKGLSGDDILDRNAENYATVDVEAQRQAWENIGIDTTDWDNQKVKETAFKSHVYAAGKVKIVDAMEDLDFQISI